MVSRVSRARRSDTNAGPGRRGEREPATHPRLGGTINTTDIGTFEPWQQAELFVIKARLLEKMGHLQEAMTSFSHGLTLW